MRIRDALGALTERNFRYLWFGQAVSAFGDRLVPVALAFAVLDLTGSARDLGYVLAAQTVPMLVFVLLAGVWADRLPRQLVMMASDLVRAAAQALIAVLLLSHQAQVWELVALSAVYGAAAAFFTPAAVGLTPLTVSPARLQEANALRGLAWSLSTILGPAFAGVIVAVTSPGWALAFDAGTFLVSASSLALIRIPVAEAKAATSSFIVELQEGWREVRSRNWLWVSIIYWGVFNITAFPAFLVLGPYVAKHSLGGASAWAAILTVGGIGSLLGGMVALRTKPARPLLACIFSTLLWWPPIALLSVRAPVALIAVAFFCASIGMAWGNTLWTTTLQQNVPASSISRVSAFDYMGTYVASPIGYALIGTVVAGFGVSPTLAATAGVGALSTVLTLSVASVRGLKRADLVAASTLT
jgi:MFS family permease